MRRRWISLLTPLLAAAVWFTAAKSGFAFEDEYAMVAGTVFREPGFALAGAEVEMKPEPDPAASNKKKAKLRKARTDSRGEFALRVPASQMRYTVTVKAAGYLSETKQVMINGAERQEVYVTLKAAAKEGQR